MAWPVTLRTNEKKNRELDRPIGKRISHVSRYCITLAASSYDSIGYRLIQQQEDSDSEGVQNQRRVRREISIDKMYLNVHNRPLMMGAYMVVNLIGLTLMITTITWTSLFKKGFTFGKTELGIDFNWHPFLMTLSLIFLYGNGALIYRIIPARNDSHKLKLKIGHAVTMIVAFVLMVIGLQAAFDSHNLASPPKPNMYTLHSWVGILAASLFGCQWLLGFLAFLFPKFSGDIRALLLPFHQYFGSSILVLAAAAALLGHLEKSIWSNKEYSSKNPEAVLVNITGVLIVLFVMGVTFILSKFSTEKADRDL